MAQSRSSAWLPESTPPGSPRGSSTIEQAQRCRPLPPATRSGEAFRMCYPSSSSARAGVRRQRRRPLCGPPRRNRNRGPMTCSIAAAAGAALRGSERGPLTASAHERSKALKQISGQVVTTRTSKRQKNRYWRNITQTAPISCLSHNPYLVASPHHTRQAGFRTIGCPTWHANAF
jgi:hypothetical protein